MLLFPAVACVRQHSLQVSFLKYPAKIVYQVSTWFRAKRGAALGLVMGASSLGGVIFPAMVTQLIPQVGFGWTLRICALLILLLTVFGNFTVISRFPPSRKPFEYLAYVRPFREPTFLFLSLGIFFFWWGMFIPINFIVSNAIQRGVRVRLARYLVPIMNATG
jgi:MFS family permease